MDGHTNRFILQIVIFVRGRYFNYSMQQNQHTHPTHTHKIQLNYTILQIVLKRKIKNHPPHTNFSLACKNKTKINDICNQDRQVSYNMYNGFDISENRLYINKRISWNITYFQYCFLLSQEFFYLFLRFYLYLFIIILSFCLIFIPSLFKPHICKQNMNAFEWE